MVAKNMHVKSSLFIKIIIFNIVAILMLTLLSQGIYYNIIVNFYRNNFVKYNLSNISISFNNIEKEIINKTASIPYNYFSNITSNRELLYPVGTDISNSAEDILKLTAKMDFISANNPNLMSMDVYYPKSNTLITGFRSVHFPYDGVEAIKYIPWHADFVKNGKSIQLMPVNTCNYPNHTKAITYVSNIPQYSKSTPDSIVAMHIDIKIFSEYIDENLGQFMIINDANNLIYESDYKSFPSFYPIIKDILPGIEVTDEVQAIDFKTDLDNMVAIVQRSEIMNINYVYIVPYKIFYEDYKGMTNLFAGISIIIIIINLIVIAFISRKNNKSYIDRIASLSEEAGVNVDKSKESIDDSIRQLVFKISTLNSEIENTKPMVYQNEIRALIFDKVSDEELFLLEFNKDHNDVYCAIINLGKDNLYYLNNIEASNHLNEKSREYPNDCEIFVTSIGRNEIAVIVCCEEDKYNDSLKWLKHFLDDELKDYQITYGKQYEMSRHGIKDSFNDAMLVYKYRFIFPEVNVLSYKDINFDNLKNSGSHLKIFEMIERGIIGSDYSEVEKKVKGLINAYKAGGYSIDYCMSTLRDLIAMLNRLIISFSMDVWVIFGYDIRNYFEQISNINVFEDWVLNMCKVIIKNNEERKNPDNAELKAVLIKLVQDNIENDISLELLADRLNIRADTLSRMFKSVVGKNYSEYVKDEKMKYSVDLLLSGKYSVGDIAEKIGYNSTQYFIKMFKSTYGETPHQYKKNRL